MFTLMPYENSLVVFAMNGPRSRQILERGYRNYWYYKYVQATVAIRITRPVCWPPTLAT